MVAWFAFVCAIATRQYLVQIPAALAAAEALGWLRGERERWKAVAVCGAACATLLGWVAFFGGLATRRGSRTGSLLSGADDERNGVPAPTRVSTR